MRSLFFIEFIAIGFSTTPVYQIRAIKVGLSSGAQLSGACKKRQNADKKTPGLTHFRNCCHGLRDSSSAWWIHRAARDPRCALRRTTACKLSLEFWLFRWVFAAALRTRCSPRQLRIIWTSFRRCPSRIYPGKGRDQERLLPRTCAEFVERSSHGFGFIRVAAGLLKRIAAAHA
jgi:hypothetical protein